MLREMHDLSTVRAILDDGLAENLHIGAQLHARVGGEVVADLAVGQARAGVAMQPDTLVSWMSMSKPVGAVAVGQLLAAGKLELDDSVAAYLPGFEQHGKEGVTLRHVLTHTAGFRFAPFSFPKHSWAEIVEAVKRARLEPNAAPGERAGYSPSATWFALAAVIEAVSGERYHDYVRTQIFEPLEMDDCWIGMAPESFDGYGERVAVLADCTDPAGCRGTREPDRERVTRTYPGGGGYGPMRQLANLWQSLLDDDGRVLPPGRVELFTKRHRVGMFDHTFQHEVDFGLGFIRTPLDDSNKRPMPYGYGPHASPETFGHGGAQSGISLADPRVGLVACLHCNGRCPEPGHQQRMRRLLAALYEDLQLV